MFALLARLKHVRRWGLMRGQAENVLEHAAFTAMIAHHLGVLHEQGGGKVSPERLATLALFHDAPEVLTGDLPTPVKYASAELKASYKALERDAAERLVETLEPQLQPVYRELMDGGSEQEKRFVKAADKLSAYLKCVEERRAGNRDFADAERSLRAQLSALGLPEVEQFLKSYEEDFGQTLDALTDRG